MGFALLEGRKPVYYGVKIIKGRNRLPHEKLKEAKAIVLNLIQDFRPQILAIEKTFFSNNRNVALLNVLAEEIKAIGMRKGLKIIAFAPSTVKRHICGNGRARKCEVAKVVVAKHPELKIFLYQNRKWKERYWQNMFDAIALGMVVERLISKACKTSTM